MPSAYDVSLHDDAAAKNPTASPRPLLSPLLKKRRRMGASLLLLASIAGIWYWQWSAPYRALNRFIAAVERKDAEAIYRLSDPQDRAQFQVTPATVAASLNAALGDRAIRRAGTPSDMTNGWRWRGTQERQQYETNLRWKDAGTGKILMHLDHEQHLMPSSTYVVVKWTAEGWRVNVPSFLFSLPRLTGRSALEARNTGGLTGYVDEKGMRHDLEGNIFEDDRLILSGATLRRRYAPPR